MKIISKTADLVDKVHSFEVFKPIDRAAIEWLVGRCEYVYYEEGDYVFQAGQAVDRMQIIMQGNYHAWINQNNEQKDLGTWGAGYVTGLLPFSRMKEARAFACALEDVYILELNKQCFTEMVNVSFELTQALVGVMSNRIRDFSRQRSHDEKLMALGKLSAGLAHEFNNPASAIVRSAQELYQNIHYTPEKFKKVITMRITEEQTDQINAILYKRLQSEPPELSILDRQDAYDDIIDWLDDHDIEDGDDMAETYVDFGVTTDDLDEVEDILDGKPLPGILGWIQSTLALERLVNEIQESSDRISELVSSVKKYSHMDRSSAKEFTDIKDGIINTVIILKHKIKAKQIKMDKVFDPNLPKFKAFVGELNQVWTNIIVNALDAMDAGGTLKIRTYQKENYICVDISDTGHGIPEEIREKIFDSFFTTKSISEGTGMGLDITRRIIEKHGGHINVESAPGCTTFSVCLPMLG